MIIKKVSGQIPPGVVKRLERTLYETIPNLKGPSPVELVKIIYDTVDFYYKKVVAKDAVCKKGCGWCCRVPVDVSAIEVQYIHDKLGIKANALEKGIDWSKAPDKTKCPFLENESCSIYEARPFNCRIFASMDSVEHCIDGATTHEIYGWQSNGGLVAMRRILDDVSLQYPDLSQMGDIREWFGEASKIKGNKIDVLFVDDCKE
ncbi:YkgJ family cysteine cluster protein [Vibrio parahaemolyticus]|nr:YkgJ family cysteine cluster protein [Vibrio parahaemolyticus]